MYVKEMHIEVRQATQKLASNRTRKLLDAEIDWLLNKNQGRFIRSKIRPKILPNGQQTGGFEILQDDLDAIKTLVRRGAVLPAFYNDPRTVRCALPGDYAYLVQDESVIKRVSPIAAVPPQKTVLQRYLLALPVNTSALPAPPYYKAVQLSLGGSIVFDLNQYAITRGAAYNGFSASDFVFALWPYLLRGLIDAGYDAYWEYYEDIFIPRSVIVVTAAPLTGSITVDGVTIASAARTINVQVTDLPGVAPEYQANRLTASNISPSLLEVAFYGTQPEFPISEITDRSLYVYPSKNFIVSNAIISYVRKPRRISLILGTDSELPEEYHQQVCDLTEEYFKQLIQDPNWQVKLEDNTKRTSL